ncbi:MAG: ACP S-malonyltransferase [Thermodesulfobacteriota bacterium]|nr:ACP S-malonyltransferase [Thermodesulfobacteriota bacterium]
MFEDNKKNASGSRGHKGYHIPELVVGCGDTVADLIEQLNTLKNAAADAPECSGLLKRLSHETHDRIRKTKALGNLRIAVTAYTEREIEKKLTAMHEMITAEPDQPFSFPTAGLFYGVGAPVGRTAFLFPGQGAQYLGMGGPLAGAVPAAGRVWDRLGAMPFDGSTIGDMVFPEDTADEDKAKAAFFRLSAADWASPAISVVGEAIFVLLQKMGVYPDTVGAHSFGDISAYRAAGIFTPEDMVRVTRYRGELGVACPLATRGCILVVPEPAERVLGILADDQLEDVWVANYNTPVQTVLSGVKAAVYKAHEVFTEKGINSRPLPISAAPHCPLAVDVAEQFFDYLGGIDFKPAQCDVYSFLFGRKVAQNDPGLFRKLLKAHVEKPVRFQSQIEQMYADGIRLFVEIGPSDMLTNLVGQILTDKPHVALCTDRKKGDAVLVFLNAAAELFKQGLIKDLEVLWEGYGIPAYCDDNGRQADAPRQETLKMLKKLDMELARINSSRASAQAV